MEKFWQKLRNKRQKWRKAKNKRKNSNDYNHNESISIYA